MTHPQGKDIRRGGPKVRIVEWLKMRAVEPLITATAAAERMGISHRTLYRDIAQATREGWLRFEDPLERIDYKVIPKALDNLDYFLSRRDKVATLETLKNTVFKTYQNSKGVSDTPLTVFALKIETIDSGDDRVITGHIIGKPKTIAATED